jgi:hypothetical protein
VKLIADILPPLPLNTVLILAGTLHGIHAITNRLTPGSGGGGLEAFEAENWGGKVFLTATGMSPTITSLLGAKMVSTKGR